MMLILTIQQLVFFTQFSGAGSIEVGDGLEKDGNKIYIHDATADGKGVKIQKILNADDTTVVNDERN